jgi:small subunit ribosomal protein S9
MTDMAPNTLEPPPPAPGASAEPKKSTSDIPFVWGTGRRKTAVARVRIRPGDGRFLVNDRKVDDFFPIEQHCRFVHTPLTVANVANQYDVFVNVQGGGITGQAGAVMLGLARALVKADAALEPKLREHNLLTRDPREVERKKYGRAGARRRFQFSKR